MTRSGATIALHFQVIVYLLEAPRTSLDLETAFLLTPERASHYLKAALYSGLIEHKPGDMLRDPRTQTGTGRRVYRPLRTITQLTKEN